LLRDEPIEARAEIRVLALEPIEPADLVGAVEMRRGLFRQRAEVPGVLVGRLIGNAVRGGPFERKRSDQLEHPEARLAVAVFAAAQQALLGERDQPLDGLRPPERLSRIDPDSADERRQPSEQIAPAASSRSLPVPTASTAAPPGP
jgi:hypothetical protein